MAEGDDDQQAPLLRSLPDSEAAEVIANLRTDDALESAIPDRWRTRDVEMHRLHAHG